MSATATRAVGYCRISDARGNGTAGVDDQQRRLRAFAAQIGWTLVRIEVENDTSAFKRRKVAVPGRDWPELRVLRPGFRRVLDDLWHGRADGLLALDLDRVARDGRDLEDLIDICEQRRVPARSVRGTLALGPDCDPTPARMLVAVANKSSRDTAKRVSEARERAALAGVFAGGRRPYGFEADGVTRREDECAVVADAAHRLLRGVPLRSLAAELRGRKVATVTGVPWSSATLREILLRPRNAGRMVWRGEVVGTAPWEPIVVPDVHDRVVRLLTDPDRRLGPGNAPRWLLSGLAYCGVCPPGTVTVAIGRAGGNPVYKCPKIAHLGRSARHVDAFIKEVVVARLDRQDARDLLVPAPPEVDAEALRDERQAIEDNLEAMAATTVLATGKAAPKARAQLRAANEAAATRLAEIDQLLVSAEGPDPELARMADAEDPAAVWEDLPLASRRALVVKLMTITILPTGRRGPGFDPSSVRVEPRTRR